MCTFAISETGLNRKRPQPDNYMVSAIYPFGSAGVRRVSKVANNEKKQEFRPGLSKKTYWHLYSLQSLESEKLARIVNKVLKKEYVLIK